MSIFAACAVFLDFSFDFGSILSEKSRFFQTRFPHGVCVFFEMATLTIVWFLQYETYFFIFRLRAFFSKKMQKVDAKPQHEKSFEKDPPRICFGDQNPSPGEPEMPEFPASPEFSDFPG